MGKPKQRKWQTTVLWEALIKRTRVEDAVRNALSLCMNSIEDVLQKGGTAPLNFTLHDSEHAFRVAQIMAKIIPAKTLGNLSVYQLALLLLSAYLHDIGMTPENGKVQAHYTFLITGSSITLTEEHKKRFQGWLDDERHSVVPPLCKGIPTSEELVLARELVAYYCRDRHNDWSEEW